MKATTPYGITGTSVDTSLPPLISTSLLSQYKLPLRSFVFLTIALVCLWPAAWAGQQMLMHIVMMTILAPAIVYALAGMFRYGSVISARWLWVATASQALIFMFWHTPYGMLFSMQGLSGESLLQGSLLIAACLFWWSLLHLSAYKTWHAILALLLTGKLFCLVALLLTFSPRALYPAMSLADQQLAGLIMITLCPLCYVVSAIWLCWHWLTDIEKTAEQHGNELLRRQACS